VNRLALALEDIREIDSDFATFVEELYQSRFTGYVGVDWFNGQPRAIYLPGARVRLDCKKNLTPSGK